MQIIFLPGFKCFASFEALIYEHIDRLLNPYHLDLIKNDLFYRIVKHITRFPWPLNSLSQKSFSIASWTSSKISSNSFPICCDILSGTMSLSAVTIEFCPSPELVHVPFINFQLLPSCKSRHHAPCVRDRFKTLFNLYPILHFPGTMLWDDNWSQINGLKRRSRYQYGDIGARLRVLIVDAVQRHFWMAWSRKASRAIPALRRCSSNSWEKLWDISCRTIGFNQFRCLESQVCKVETVSIDEGKFAKSRLWGIRPAVTILFVVWFPTPWFFSLLPFSLSHSLSF